MTRTLKDCIVPTRVDWLMGAVLLTSKEAVAHVGAMDESFLCILKMLTGRGDSGKMGTRSSTILWRECIIIMEKNRIAKEFLT